MIRFLTLLTGYTLRSLTDQEVKLHYIHSAHTSVAHVCFSNPAIPKELTQYYPAKRQIAHLEMCFRSCILPRYTDYKLTPAQKSQFFSVFNLFYVHQQFFKCFVTKKKKLCISVWNVVRDQSNNAFS